MLRISPNRSLPIIERYEMKFLIPAAMIEPIACFASIYCTLDLHSQQSTDGFYQINNLYLDTPHFLFLKKRRSGSDNRFNMRIRSYGDQPSHCYLEVKQKKVNIVRKFRSQEPAHNWHQSFPSPGDPPLEDTTCRATVEKELFLRLAHSYMATPKVQTQYRRMAYVSNVDDYGRVTFDTDLRYFPQEQYTLLAPKQSAMVPLDEETLFDPGCSVILELKCHCRNVPLWMIDLIRYFNLKRIAFSKYVTGISQILKLHAYDPSNRATAVVL